MNSIIKNLLGVIIISVAVASCLEVTKISLLKQDIGNGTTIEATCVDAGATTRGAVLITKTDHSRSVILKQIDGSYLDAKASLSRINDTLFKITFTDTTVFKGKDISYEFSLNERKPEGPLENR